MSTPADKLRWGAPHLETVAPYVPGRSAQDVERELGIDNAIKLASNECPTGASPRALDAARRALSESHRYPDDDVGALRERLAADHGVTAPEVVCGHGSNELIDLLCRAVLPPDGHAIIGSPSFVAYGLALQTTAAPYTVVPLRRGLFWDLDALLDAVTDATRLIFIDSPNNPTSTHIPADDLREFLSRVPPRVLVVVDEAYHHFADADDYGSAMHMRDTRERLAVLRTFSKAHGLCALRVGYAVAPAPLCEYLQRLRLPFNVNAAGQAAALASLDDPQHLASYLTLNREQRALLTGELSARGWRVAPSQANFLYATPTAPASQVYEQLLAGGVIVRMVGKDLGLRISVGTAADNQRLLARLDELGG